MNRIQENYFSMMLAVKTVCNKFIGTIENLPALKNTYNAFLQIADNVINLRSIQEKDTTGVTRDKAVKAEELINHAMGVVGGVTAFALTTGNNELFKSLNFSKSSLAGSGDTGLISRIQTLYDNILPIVGKLSDYNITSEKLSLLNDLKEQYKSIVQAPRAAKSETSTATDELETNIQAAREKLEIMDRLMLTLAVSEKTFYSEYQSARIIIDLGSGGKKENEPVPIPLPE